MKVGIKYFCVIIFTFAIVSPKILAQVKSISARQNVGAGNVDIRWECDYNDNIAYFEVYRSQDKNDIGGRINDGNILPNQNQSSYRYTDGELFRSNLAASTGTYYYRIRVIYKVGSPAVSDYADVNFSSSTAKRTWGSIKAMFR